jgi:glycosyltransferase involved in cell wall biosynthesis
VPEIITQGEDGVLVEPRSVEAVAAAMSKLLEFPDSRRAMGERARTTVQTRFSPRRQCEVMSQHYSRMLAAA